MFDFISLVMDAIFLIWLATTLVDVFVISTSATWLPNGLCLILFLPGVCFLNELHASEKPAILSLQIGATS